MAGTSVGVIARIVALVLRPLLDIIDDIFVEFLFKILDIDIPVEE
jgi:hypothetical protein